MSGLPTGTLTFLLSDVPGSTEMWTTAAAAMSVAVSRLDELVAEAVDRGRGWVVKPRGENDSHFTVFTSAAEAIATAVILGRSVAAEPWPDGALLRPRLSLYTGEAELRDHDYYGACVNRCARLRSAAHPCQIVVGEPTARAGGSDLPDGATLLDLGLHFLKDVDRPLRAFQLCHSDLPSDFPPLASLAPPGHGLPLPHTSFIGRDALVGRILTSIGPGSVIQLTGGPGVGKSRLALELAARLPGAERGGARLIRPSSPNGFDVDLDDVTLLVLDDVDHAAADVSALVSALQRTSPDIAVVVTARAPMDLATTVVETVPPLDLPDPEADELEIRESPAVQLFLSRLEAVRSMPDPSADALFLIAEVCRQLEGLPLAIELAASRGDVLTLQQLAARLSDPLRLLVGNRSGAPHHRSMRDAVDWSIDQLEPNQRASLEGLIETGEDADSNMATVPLPSFLESLAIETAVGPRLSTLVMCRVRERLG